MDSTCWKQTLRQWLTRVVIHKRDTDTLDFDNPTSKFIEVLFKY